MGKINELINILVDGLTKEEITLNCESMEQLLDYITNLQQEIEDLKEQVKYQDLWRNEYLSRIDKAIEYINSDEMLKLREDFEYCNDKDLFDEFAGHLDRILRGSDKE